MPADFTSKSYTVEGDWSNSAFLDALTLVGGEVEVDYLKATFTAHSH